VGFNILFGTNLFFWARNLWNSFFRGAGPAVQKTGLFCKWLNTHFFHTLNFDLLLGKTIKFQTV
jgi:hypothetical protein